MVLQAVTFEKQGRTDDALAVLEEAVDLARPGEWIRPFVESGPTMEGLLKRLAENNIAVDYIGQLLTALREYQLGVKPEELGTQVELRPSFGIQPLVEPLTNRELEILELLAQRLRNKEIAAKLFISEKTIKKHLNNIYRKLSVTSRRQALEKAVVLGILVRR
jgi:LuxR family maltose regulon positive regulatory protein